MCEFKGSRFMPMFKPLSGVIAASFLLIAQPGHADTQRDPYTDLVMAIASDEIAVQALDAEMARAPEEWGKIPEFAELEADCPGFIQGYAVAMRAAYSKGHMQDYAWYRGKLDTLFRAELTEAEAEQGAAFYSSPLGIKLMRWVWANRSVDATIAEAMANPETDTSRQAYDADMQATRQQVRSDFTLAEQIEIKEALGSGFGPKLLMLQPRMNQLTFEMFNREFTPDVEAEIDQAADSFIDNHIAACEAP